MFDQKHVDNMRSLGSFLEAAIPEATAGNTRLQNLICIGLPIYNMFAATQGWPVIPIPAFCSST